MRIVTGTGGFTVAWFIAIFENLTKATQNGARTAIVFARQSKTRIKEFWILILEYNNSLRAPWKRCEKIESKSKHGSNNRESNRTVIIAINREFD